MHIHLRHIFAVVLFIFLPACCMDTQIDIQNQLVQAVQKGDIPSVQHWIAQGADIHAGSYIGDPLIHRAALAGHTHMVRFLQSHGLTLQGYDACGLTIVHKAAVVDNTELLDYLIHENQLNKNVITWDDQYLCTPLHLAIFNNKKRAVQYLVCAGASIDAVCQHNTTPLHLAVSLGLTDIIDYLIQSGADVEKVNAYGRTILDLAAIHNRPKVIKLLVEKYCFDPAACDCRAYKLAQEYDAQEAIAEFEYQIQRIINSLSNIQ